MQIVIDTPGEDDETEAELVRGILEGAIYGAAPSFFRRGLPRLAQSGIVFAEDPEYGSGIERFRLPWEVLESGAGDCNDLIVYRGCELIAYDKCKPKVRALWLGDDLHVQLRKRAGAKPEDPSIFCGARVDWPRWLLGV